MAEPPGLLEPAVLVDATAAADDLREQLATSGFDLAIVMSDGRAVRLLTAADAAALDAGASVLQGAGPPPPSCESSRSTSEMAAALRDRPALGVVVLAGGRPVGVVRAATLAGLRGDPTRTTDRLPGDPLSELVFGCAAHDERTSIEYYDPDNPPRCSHGDLMRRVRR